MLFRSPRYAAALAAAQEPQPEPEQPAQEQPADAEPEQAQEEQPARDPKQARGPVPDKAFIGLEIKGKGWKIVFDGSYDRTRVIFKPVSYTHLDVYKRQLPSSPSWKAS